MSDLLLDSRGDGSFDLAFDGDLLIGESLKSAILISIGSYARKKYGFSNMLNDDGWWGESTIEGDKWGNLLHDLANKRNDSNLLLLVRQYVKNSIQWLIDDGVVSSFDVDVDVSEKSLNIEIIANKGGKNEDYRFEILWSEVV